MRTILSKRSLKFWIAAGIALALAPLAASAVGGYVLLDRGVIVKFDDVAHRQRHQVTPLLQLRMSVWDALAPVDEYVDGGDPAKPLAYRLLRERVETAFATLISEFQNEPDILSRLERAEEEWTTADHLATELISVRHAPGDPEALAHMQRFHGAIAAAADKLDAAHAVLAATIQKDHDVAILYFERARWLAAFAALLSTLMVFAGVALIGRIMTSSVDRLVEGAARFAEGDRSHRIDIHVPPELQKVAEEFNRMIGRINDSETALSELAHRDGLTRLWNRRAFDDAMAETFAHIRRSDERYALLSLDIDHFKRVNDTYGHSSGDDVLRAVAQTFLTEVRPFDRVFRAGGEEFAILVSGLDVAAAHDMAERIREAVEALSVSVRGDVISPTVSIGVAMANEAATPVELIDAADQALYRAKESGRNRVVVNSDDENGPDKMIMDIAVYKTSKAG